MIKALVLTTILVSTNVLADWQNPNFKYDAKNNFTNKTTVTIRAVDNVDKVCETESRKRGRNGFGFAMQACSFWEANTCTIIIPKKFTIDNLGHEMLHCLQGNYHD